MKTRALLPLCFILGTSVALAGPIPVSGGGTFVDDDDDSSFTISFSGSNGVDTVSVFAQCGGGYWSGDYVWGGPGFCDGGVLIDGLSFYFGEGITPAYAEFSLGNGSGYATGYNPSPDQYASVSLIGYVGVTSESCSGPPWDSFCTGSFGVSPTPEPGSLALGLLGLGAIALRMARKRIRTGSSGAI
jgi:MYXO-CTERM domain-containing protein